MKKISFLTSLVFIFCFVSNYIFSAVSENINTKDVKKLPCTLEINKVFGDVSIISARLIRKHKGRRLKYAKKDETGHYVTTLQPGRFYGAPDGMAHWGEITVKCMYCPMLHTVILETEDPSACQDMVLAQVLENHFMMGI